MVIDFAWYFIIILWILGSLLMFITNDFILNIDKKTGLYKVYEGNFEDKIVAIIMSVFWPIVMVIYLVFAAINKPKQKKE